MAAFLGAVSTRAFVRRQQLTADAAHFLEETIRSIVGLQSRAIRENPVPLPRAGSLAATGLSACDPGNGTRISGIALSVPVPAHIALVGKPEAGARVFAALVGGQLEPSAGRLTLGDVDLAAVDPIERARRIAYAGGETVLIPGSLRDNLAYGCPPGPDLEARLANAVAVAGLETFVHERGLAGTLDPSREAHLAAAIVDARHAVRRALGAKGIDRLVEPFDHGRYNQHATIGENLLFGKPIGDTFREENLASHPFIRAILDSEGLTRKLAAIGHSIAVSMVEIFAEIPDGHPLFARFSFFSSGDRAYFADLVARHAEWRRSNSARDRERLIGLALRYSESRHRLGLLDESLQRSLLSARASFAKMLPLSLQPSIEIYDASRLCAAASVQDNLLFGRIVFDQAGAEAAVQAIVAEVLSERSLDADVTRIGMDSPVDPVASDLTSSRRVAIDLVRCLVRQPDIVVVERALDGLPAPQANALVARLRRALVGRGLLLVTPRISDAMEQPPFDAVIRFERGSASLERAAPKRELEPA